MEKFYLLQTAQSLIDQCVLELYKKYQTENTNNEGGLNSRQRKGQYSQLMSGVKILKFKNQEAYLYGETQLIYFSDVRESLKTN